MAANLTIQPFNTGIHRGLILQYFDAASIADVGVNVDLTEWYERGMISKVSSVEMFSQYGRLVFKDKSSGLTRYNNVSTMTNQVLNTKSKRFEITYSNVSGGAAPVTFDIVLYESMQPTFVQGVTLP